MITIFFGKDKKIRLQKTTEKKFIEDACRFYEESGEDKVLFSKTTLNEAILIEAEQNKQELLDNLIKIGQGVALNDIVYRCDYIQDGYQVEEITEQEACLAFLKNTYKTFFIFNEDEIHEILKTGSHPMFSHPRAVEIIRALKETL